jgi:hypothetical protein
MAEAKQQTEPPKLKRTPEGAIDNNSLADTVEFFLNFDDRVAAMRHVHVQELFEWKQQDDKVNGVEPAPFETAEQRFAIGIFLALEENNAQPLLQLWITDVLEALGAARETTEQIDHSYNLLSKQGQSLVQEANKIPSNTEKRIYLTSCWLEALCTAEARVLGWIYQEIYGVPYQPAAPEDFAATDIN